MPKVGIGDTPTQIAQAVTEGAVLQNVGNSVVYAEGNSSVSSTAYGYAISPRATLSWGEGKDLWLVCANGDSTEVTVMYGGTTTGLSEVAAVVTGDVTATIDGPVNAEITGPVTVEGTVNVGNVVQTETTVTNNVATTVSNTVTTEVSGTVDTVVTAPVAISGTVDVAGDVGITGPVTVSGAVNISGGTVEADITGPVTIGGAVTVGGINTPVQVQGGGSILANQTATAVPGSGVRYNIAAPANGLTYYGIGVILRVTSKTVSNNVPLTASIYNMGLATSTNVSMQAALPAAGATNLGTFGGVSTASVVLPMGAAYPLVIDIDHNGAAGTGNISYILTVVGLSYADPFPHDLLQWENGSTPSIAFSNAAANSYAIIAASHEQREYLLTSLTATTGNFRVETLSSSGAWTTSQDRAHNSVYGSAPVGADVSANINSLIKIPGDGRVHRISCVNAVTGFISLAYLGRSS